MRYPFPPEEFEQLPDDMRVVAREFCSTNQARGFYPKSKTHLKRRIEAGEPGFIRGRTFGNGTAATWSVGEVKVMVEALSTEL